MITYNTNAVTKEVSVFLDGKRVGTIQRVTHAHDKETKGYQYLPLGETSGGEIMETLRDVKNSLEAE